MIRVHRRKPWFRAALLGLLALCVVLQPVLAATGDLHEVLDHPAQAALHLDGTGQHDAAESGDGQPTELLHTLLHIAHCCGQTVSFHALSPKADWVPANEPRPLNVAVAPTLQLRCGAPFRPPIQA